MITFLIASVPRGRPSESLMRRTDISCSRSIRVWVRNAHALPGYNRKICDSSLKNGRVGTEASKC